MAITSLRSISPGPRRTAARVLQVVGCRPAPKTFIALVHSNEHICEFGMLVVESIAASWVGWVTVWQARPD